MCSDLLPSKGRLTVDLAALRKNYEILVRHCGKAVCAPVLKANAYGLGVEPVARTLAQAGASCFFVAMAGEGIQLRTLLPSAQIFILHGFMPGEAEGLARRGLVPVLNTLEQLHEWRMLCHLSGKAYPAALQLDTGMSRFGLGEAELFQGQEMIKGLNLCLVMSHLACADIPSHEANRRQLAMFERMTASFSSVPRSLAASSGIFLGSEYHFDLVRPGAALYGIAPQQEGPNPLSQVVTLQVPICQVREIKAGDFVGYGCSWQAPRTMRIGTVEAGYADGLFRSLGGQGVLWHRGMRLPILGRVSMDSMTIDLSALEDDLKPGDEITVIGPEQSLDKLAEDAGTIAYEVLTALGKRYQRDYRDWEDRS